MSFQQMLCLTAVLSVLSAGFAPAYSQTAYDEKALKEAIESIVAADKAPKCDPFIDPGCHIPVPGSTGPDGCSDCKPSALLDALRQGDKYLLPDNVEINGSKIKLLEKYETGAGTTLSLPSQIGQ